MIEEYVYLFSYTVGDIALLLEAFVAARCRFLNCEGLTPGALLTDEFSLVCPELDFREAALAGRAESFLHEKTSQHFWIYYRNTGRVIC